MSRGGISCSNLAGPDALERFYTARSAEVAAAGLRDHCCPVNKVPNNGKWAWALDNCAFVSVIDLEMKTKIVS